VAVARICKGGVVLTMVGHGCGGVRVSTVYIVHDVVHQGHIGHGSSSGSRRMVLSDSTMIMSVNTAVAEMVLVVMRVVLVVVRRMGMSP